VSLPCIVLALPRAVEGTLAATALQKLLKLLRCQALADGNPEERSWFTGVPGFWWPLVRTLENDRKVCVCACYKYTLIATHPPSIRFAPYFWCSLSHLSHRGSSVAIPRPVKSSVGLCPPWISKYCLLFIPIALRARAKALWDLSDPWSSAFSFGLVWTDALGAIIDKRHTTPAVPTAPKAKPSSRITKHWLDHSTLSPDTLHIASCYIHTSNSSLLQNLQTFGDSSASSASQFCFFAIALWTHFEPFCIPATASNFKQKTTCIICARCKWLDQLQFHWMISASRGALRKSCDWPWASACAQHGRGFWSTLPMGASCPATIGIDYSVYFTVFMTYP